MSVFSSSLWLHDGCTLQVWKECYVINPTRGWPSKEMCNPREFSNAWRRSRSALISGCAAATHELCCSSSSSSRLLPSATALLPTVLLLNNLLPLRPTDQIHQIHQIPTYPPDHLLTTLGIILDPTTERVLPFPDLSLANCTSPDLRDFLNMTGLKRLCEPAKFEIFAEF